MLACQSSHIQVLLRKARLLADAFDSFKIFNAFGEDNLVADALCNYAFVKFTSSNNNWNQTTSNLNWLHDLNLIKYWMSLTVQDGNWEEIWALVQNEIRSIRPMIRDRWIPSVPDFDVPVNLINTVKVINVEKASSITKAKWPYVFAEAGLDAMMALVAELPFRADNHAHRRGGSGSCAGLYHIAIRMCS